MKKTQRFESWTLAKFQTAETKELKSVTGGLVRDVILDTVTVYSDGTSANDHQDYPIDKGAEE